MEEGKKVMIFGPSGRYVLRYASTACGGALKNLCCLHFSNVYLATHHWHSKLQAGRSDRSSFRLLFLHRLIPSLQCTFLNYPGATLQLSFIQNILYPSISNYRCQPGDSLNTKYGCRMSGGMIGITSGEEVFQSCPPIFSSDSLPCNLL